MYGIKKTVQQVMEALGCQTNDAEQKQGLKINPELVKIEPSTEVLDFYPCRASLDQRDIAFYSTGCISLYSFGTSEEEARATLDTQFEALVLRCVNAEATKSEASSATFQDQFSKLKEEQSNQSSKVKAFVEAVNRITRSEAPGTTPDLDNSRKVDDTPAPESKKAEPQKAEEKNQAFKLNPNRVTSRIDPTIQSYSRWEARTTLYFGETPLEVVSSGHMTEESARTALDYKVGKLIDGMTD